MRPMLRPGAGVALAVSVLQRLPFGQGPVYPALESFAFWCIGEVRSVSLNLVRCVETMVAVYSSGDGLRSLMGAAAALLVLSSASLSTREENSILTCRSFPNQVIYCRKAQRPSGNISPQQIWLRRFQECP